MVKTTSPGTAEGEQEIRDENLAPALGFIGEEFETAREFLTKNYGTQPSALGEAA